MRRPVTDRVPSQARTRNSSSACIGSSVVTCSSKVSTTCLRLPASRSSVLPSEQTSINVDVPVTLSNLAYPPPFRVRCTSADASPLSSVEAVGEHKPLTFVRWLEAEARRRGLALYAHHGQPVTVGCLSFAMSRTTSLAKCAYARRRFCRLQSTVPLPPCIQKD